MRSPFILFRYLNSRLAIQMSDLIVDEIDYVRKQKEKEYDISPLKILDLGSGFGGVWNNVKGRTVFSELKILITLIDIDSDLLNRASVNSLPQAKFDLQVGLLPNCLEKFATDSFDLVLGIDLIEHLSKEDGYRLLYEIDRIGKMSSMLVTPNGFVWQPPALNNRYNAHISSWTSEELKTLGWTRIRGLVGFRSYWGPYSQPLRQPTNSFWWEFYALQKIIASFFPKVAFSILAVKRRKNPRIELQ